MIYFESPITYKDLMTKLFALIPFNDGIVAIMDNEKIYGVISASFYPWQLVTYQFIHGDFMHLLFNMFMMWMFGMEIENIMGSKKFLTYYLLCGIIGGVVKLLFDLIVPGPEAITVGSSGSVWGIMIAFAMYFPNRYVFIYFLVPIKAKYLIAFLFVIELFSIPNQDLIAHSVHVGGAVTGFVFLILDKRNNFNISNLLNSFKKPRSFSSFNGFRKSSHSSNVNQHDIYEAKFKDLNKSDDELVVNQEEIDRILDKISQSGYQKLTEREKKILFEASKRK
jgi:membrane associated rhomboid family serine protease